MEKGKLIVIVGASGVGKSALGNEVILDKVRFIDGKNIKEGVYSWEPEYVDELRKITTDSNNSTFYAKRYLTREPRQEDVGIVHCTKEEMDSQCDVIMPGYKDGDFVGFNTNEIMEQIDNGKFPVITTGIISAVQEIVKAFYEKQRLDDIYLVGIWGLLMSLDNYANLEKGRYKGSEIKADTIESAKKRHDKSLLFARQYSKFRLMFDYEVINYRIKFARDPNLKDEASDICRYSSRKIERSEEQIRCLMEFICCNLQGLAPVREEEILLLT